MSPDEIKLVRDSFNQLAPVKIQVAETFYNKLFTVAPEVKPLFKSDMAGQYEKVMGAIAFAVAGLDRLDEIVPTVEDLARRHVSYGVKASHYAIVGGALADTLKDMLGDGFTPEVQAAWTTAYGLLSETMIAAAA